MPGTGSSQSTANLVCVASGMAGQPDFSKGSRRTSRTAKSRRFFLIYPQRGTKGGGYELLNDRIVQGQRIFGLPIGRRGFRDHHEIPVFLFEPRLGWAVRDFEEYGGYWLISERMKVALESVDAEAFVFLKCKIQFPDGTDAPPRWLCDVVRILDALDEEKSEVTVRILNNGSKVYNYSGRPYFRFKEDAVGSCHVFRMMHRESLVVCDEKLKLACTAAGLKGIRFIDSVKR